ncbi:transcription factor e(y)2-domain-containing protein [Kockiozyma suomiensis]|uniref:transcription factor e(y)2-domain-containing protein n=1 Tax=Kockiozyma suomiensis TaxID=1337062 RepID=UPI0033439F32
MADSQIRAKVHQKLVESGEYERISTHLRQKLVESGWYDQVNQLASEKLRFQDNPNFDKLVDDIEPKALDSVPDEIKLDVLNMIKNFLDGIVEK